MAVCVFLGAYYPLFQQAGEFWQVMAAAFSAMLIAGAGYVINDYYDLETDMINKPQRVLPSGKMSSRAAFIYGIILFIIGIILSYFTGSVICILLAFVNAIALFLYAGIFKRAFVSGNLLVSYAAASTFVYGAIVTDNLSQSLIIAFFAFLYTFLREIIKDMEDRRGDQLTGAHTLALSWKKSQVLALFLVTVMLMIAGCGIFFMKQLIDYPVFALLMFFVILPLLIFYRILSTLENETVYRKISRLMKFDMLILLVIFIIGNKL